jgi:hypothetical protein
MELPTNPNLTISMMLALTRSHNACVTFKKFQVDASIMIDPTRTREECEEAINTQMNLQMSKNLVTGVSLPVAFISQDYSKQIATLRKKRKVDALNKVPRKVKRVIDSESDEFDMVVKPSRTTSSARSHGKTKLKVDRSLEESDAESEDDDDVNDRVPRKKKPKVESKEVDASEEDSDEEEPIRKKDIRKTRIEDIGKSKEVVGKSEEVLVKSEGVIFKSEEVVGKSEEVVGKLEEVVCKPEEVKDVESKSGEWVSSSSDSEEVEPEEVENEDTRSLEPMLTSTQAV